MKSLLILGAFAVILMLALLLAVVLSDAAPWYFAWLVGATMIVLISASGAVLFEAQDAGGTRNPG